MSFSYTPFATNLDKVRFHLGDVDEQSARYQDEEIAGALGEYGDVPTATIALIQSLIARLSVPDFKADWLQVDHSSARQAYVSLLAQKRAEFGQRLSMSTATVHAYRVDSDATEAPYGGG
jgi:hypothetical protein